MNNDYLNYKKCLDDLTTVLSIGYFFKYSTRALEKRIIDSNYFAAFNKKFLLTESYISSDDLLENVFYDAEIGEEVKDIFYNELEWVATLYIYLIENTELSFEVLFCYLPISKAIDMFKIYHEQDLNKCLKWFNEERKKYSLMKIRMKSLNVSNYDVATTCGISYSMVNSLKNRQRDIKKLSLEQGIKLANYLNFKVESLIKN